jgi:hypothetical protein
MSRGASERLANQEEARKDAYTGMIQQSVSQIPSDYTPEQKASITTAEMGGIDVGYGNLRDEMMRRASATGSSAGIPESLNEAGRESIRAKADAGAKLQEMFANVPTQRALQQASIYQPALSGMLYNRPLPQSSGILNSIIGAGGAIGAALLGKGRTGGTGGTAGCWIAVAVYGRDSWKPEFIWQFWTKKWANESRFYRILLGLYLIVGELSAWVVQRIPLLKRACKMLFDHALQKAEKDFRLLKA